MIGFKQIKYAFFISASVTLIGLITFVISWTMYDYFDGPIPGYSVLLFPGNQSLVYFWHPIFTEEVALIPKLGMILLGQFTLVFLSSFIVLSLAKWIQSIR